MERRPPLAVLGVEVAGGLAHLGKLLVHVPNPRWGVLSVPEGGDVEHVVVGHVRLWPKSYRDIRQRGIFQQVPGR